MIKRLLLLSVNVLVMLAVVVALHPLPVAQAQEETDPEPAFDAVTRIEGEISFPDDGDEDGEIRVNGYAVAPTGAFKPSDFEPGDYVIVWGYLLNDDTFKATDIKLGTAPDGEPVPDDPGDVDTGDDDGDDGDGDSGEADCQHYDHPVLLAYAGEFGVGVELLADAHCNGAGLGEIGRALLLWDSGETGDDDWQDILAKRDETGWGDVLKFYGVEPNELAPGRVISGRDGDDEDERPGNSGNAPGHSDTDDDDGDDDDDDDDGPGNSENAPGQKDKDKKEKKDKKDKKNS